MQPVRQQGFVHFDRPTPPELRDQIPTCADSPRGLSSVVQSNRIITTKMLCPVCDTFEMIKVKRTDKLLVVISFPLL